VSASRSVYPTGTVRSYGLETLWTMPRLDYLTEFTTEILKSFHEKAG
jgi:hypothetical protein